MSGQKETIYKYGAFTSLAVEMIGTTETLSPLGFIHQRYGVMFLIPETVLQREPTTEFVHLANPGVKTHSVTGVTNYSHSHTLIFTCT